MVAVQSKSKAFAVVGVFLLMSGLVLGLFDEARAVSMQFQDAPTVVGTSGSYYLNIIIPDGERVPIERITAVIERQADGASDKTGATELTRATCDFTGAAQICTASQLTTTGTVTSAITSIAFVGYYSATSGEQLDASGSFGYGALLGTTTGYGYEPTSGYGYDLGSKSNFNAGTGYGYGRSDGQDLALRFHVVVNAVDLELRPHYLTVLADTGSHIIGKLSSPYTQFTVARTVTTETTTVTEVPSLPSGTHTIPISNGSAAPSPTAAIPDITIRSAGVAGPVTLNVTLLSSAVPGLPAAPLTGGLLLSWNITLTNATGQPVAIESANVTFNVNATWVASVCGTNCQLRLVHWNGTAWEILPLTLVSQTGDIRTYSVTTTSFSPFYLGWTHTQVGGGGGGGKTIPEVGTGGGGGGGGGGTPLPTEQTLLPTKSAAGAVVTYLVQDVRAAAGGHIYILTGDDSVPRIHFTTDREIQDGKIEAIVRPGSDAPAGLGALPGGVESVHFIEVTISTGGQQHTVEFSFVLPQGADQTVLVKWDPATQSWTPKDTLHAGAHDGLPVWLASSACCSDFALVIDAEAPTISLAVDDPLAVQRVFTATATDNLAVDRVEFWLEDVLVHTARAAPYVWTWDSERAGEGEFTVVAVAYDFAGNSAENERVTGQTVVTPDDVPTFWDKMLVPTLVVSGLALMVGGGWYYQRRKNQ